MIGLQVCGASWNVVVPTWSIMIVKVLALLTNLLNLNFEFTE